MTSWTNEKSISVLYSDSVTEQKSFVNFVRKESLSATDKHLQTA